MDKKNENPSEEIRQKHDAESGNDSTILKQNKKHPASLNLQE